MGHHWEESGSVISTSSLQVFTDTDKIPLNFLFSRLTSPSSQPVLRGGDAPVPPWHSWPLTGLSPVHPCFPWLGSHTGHMLQAQLCQHPTKGKDHSPGGTTPPSTDFSGARTAPGKLHKWLSYSFESWNIKMGTSLRTPAQHSWRDWPMLCDKAIPSYVGKATMGKLKAKMIRNQILKMALWMSNSIPLYYYFQQVLVKWFMKSNTTENPHCTRHGSLETVGAAFLHEWGWGYSLPLPGRALQHIHTGSTIYSLKHTGRSGTSSRSVQTLLQKCFSSRLTPAQPLAKFKRKRASPPKNGWE